MNDSIGGKNTREMPLRPPGSTAPGPRAGYVTATGFANEKGPSEDEP